MKTVLISDKVVEDFTAEGSNKVKFAIHLLGIDGSNATVHNFIIPGQVIKEGENEPMINIKYSVKAVLNKNISADKIITVEPNSKDVYVKTSTETMTVKLSEISIPKITLSSFKSSRELQDALDVHYLKEALNKTGKYGCTNWTEFKQEAEATEKA